MSAASSEPSPKTIDDNEPKSRFLYIVPVILFAVIATAFAVGLTLNPKNLPSVLIGKPVPEFDLPPVQGRTVGMSSKSLKGKVSLVNVWASWCTECRAEHPLFMELKRSGIVPLNGLNYKDQPADAAKWLDDLGDPYTQNGADINGRVAIDWGVYGVPETFVVDRDGTIVYKHIGRVTPDALNNKILPLVRKLQAAPIKQSNPSG